MTFDLPDPRIFGETHTLAAAMQLHEIAACQKQTTLEAFESPDPSIFGGTLQQAPS